MSSVKKKPKKRINRTSHRNDPEARAFLALNDPTRPVPPASFSFPRLKRTVAAKLAKVETLTELERRLRLERNRPFKRRWSPE